MKKIVLILLFFGTISYGQTKGISYQALILDPVVQELPGFNNELAPLANKTICLKFSILDELSSLEYEEIFTTTTDDVGMVNLIIGNGTNTGGYASSFEDIVWSTLAKNLSVDLSVKGNCTDYENISIAPFTAVPFALFAVNTQDTPLVLENEAEIILLKSLLAATQTGAGLNIDGTYTPDASTNYISSVTSLKEADTALDSQVKNNEDAITINTAKTGITTVQSDAIIANTGKVSMVLGTTAGTALAGDTSLLQIGTTATTALAGDTLILQIGTTAGTALAGDTSLLQLGTTAGTALEGDTSLLQLGTTATTALAGDTPILQLGTTATTALAGDTSTITTVQANAIIANTAKETNVSTDLFTTTSTTTITVNSSDGNNAVLPVASTTDGGVMSAALFDEVTANTAKDGITTVQANAIIANTAKETNVSTDLSTTTSTTTITVNSSDGNNAVLPVASTTDGGVMSAALFDEVTANTAKDGITTVQANAIIANTAKETNVSTDLSTTTSTTTITVNSSDGNNAVLPVASTTDGGVMSAALFDEVTANTAKDGITTVQANAIIANTAKETNVSTDLSTTTSTTTITVNSSDGNNAVLPVASTTDGGVMSAALFDEVTANTAKDGITTVQANAIIANTAKETNVSTDLSTTTSTTTITVNSSDGNNAVLPVASTTDGGVMSAALFDEVTANTAKDGITTVQANAIIANTAKETNVSTDLSTTTSTTTITVNSSDGNNAVLPVASTTDGGVMSAALFDEVTANTAKDGITTVQANAIIANTAKETNVSTDLSTTTSTTTITVNSSDGNNAVLPVASTTDGGVMSAALFDEVTANTAKDGITTVQANAIIANTAKETNVSTDLSTTTSTTTITVNSSDGNNAVLPVASTTDGGVMSAALFDEVTANTAKDGITTVQANAIIANTAKETNVSTDLSTTTSTTTITVNSSDGNNAVLPVASTTDGGVMSAALFDEVTANTAKDGITTVQANAIIANTAKETNVSTDLSTTTSTTTITVNSSDGNNAVLPVASTTDGGVMSAALFDEVTANTAKDGITTVQANAIIANTAKETNVSTDLSTTTSTTTITVNSSDGNNAVLPVASTTDGGVMSAALFDEVTANTAKDGITTVQANAIIANTAKETNVSTDLSTTTSTTTITVNSSDGNNAVLPVASTTDGGVMSAALFDEVTANTAKDGITTVQANAIIANTAKETNVSTDLSTTTSTTTITVNSSDGNNAVLPVASTTDGGVMSAALFDEVTANTAKDGITTVQANAIIANTAKETNVSTDLSTTTSTTTITVNSSDGNNAVLPVASTTDGGVMSAALFDEVTANTAKDGITTVQANAIIANTAKETNVSTDLSTTTSTTTITVNSSDGNNAVLPVASTTDGGVMSAALFDEVTANTAKDGITTVQANAIIANTAKETNVSTDLSTTTSTTTITVNSSDGNNAVLPVASTTDGGVMSAALFDEVTANTAKDGITTVQANAIIANTAKETNVSTDLSTTTSTTTITVNSSDGNNAVLPVASTTDGGVMSAALFDEVTANTAKDGITTVQANAIIANTAKETNVSTDLSTTTSTTTITVNSSDGNNAVLPVASTTDGGVMSAALFDEVTANTAKDGITTVQANAIIANTAKETNVSTDLSTTTSTTTITVNSSDGNNAVLPVASTTDGGVMSAALFDEVTANTAKDGITTVQANAIIANTAKETNVSTDLSTTTSTTTITVNSSDGNNAVLPVASTTDGGVMSAALFDEVTANTAKDGITTVQANAIIANTAKETNVSTDLSTTTSTTTITVNSSDGNNAVLPVASTTDGGVMSADLFDEVTANTAKITTDATSVLAAGAVMTTGVQTITGTKTFSSTIIASSIDSDGALELNSSTGAISIGNDAIAQNINIGTGAAARTVTIGNATGATAINLTSGSGGITMTTGTNGAISIDPNGTGNLTLGSADNTTTSLSGNAMNIDAAGALTLDGATGVNIAGNAAEIDVTTTGAIDINGADITVDASAGISLDAAAASNITTSVGALTLNGAAGVDITSTLDVTGVTTLTGDLVSNGGDITNSISATANNIFATSTGKTTLGGGAVDLGASGSATTVKGTLDVTGATTVRELIFGGTKINDTSEDTILNETPDKEANVTINALAGSFLISRDEQFNAGGKLINNTFVTTSSIILITQLESVFTSGNETSIAPFIVKISAGEFLLKTDILPASGESLKFNFFIIN